VLIEENGCLVFDLCMIMNKTLPLITRKLVWFVICVCWVLVEPVFSSQPDWFCLGRVLRLCLVGYFFFIVEELLAQWVI